MCGGAKRGTDIVKRREGRVDGSKRKQDARGAAFELAFVWVLDPPCGTGASGCGYDSQSDESGKFKQHEAR